MKIWEGNCRYVIIALVVLILTFVVGAFFIDSLNYVIQDKNVNYTDVIVANKYIDNDSEHFFVVVSEQGDVYDIVNITDGKDIFNSIEVGKHYRFIIKEPLSVDDKYIHILEVHDAHT